MKPFFFIFCELVKTPFSRRQGRRQGDVSFVIFLKVLSIIFLYGLTSLLSSLMHTPVSLYISLISYLYRVTKFNKCFILLAFKGAISDNPAKDNIVIFYIAFKLGFIDINLPCL